MVIPSPIQVLKYELIKGSLTWFRWRSFWASIRHCCPRSRSTWVVSLPRPPRWTPAPRNSAPTRASGSLAGQWSRLSPGGEEEGEMKIFWLRVLKSSTSYMRALRTIADRKARSPLVNIYISQTGNFLLKWSSSDLNVSCAFDTWHQLHQGEDA